MPSQFRVPAIWRSPSSTVTCGWYPRRVTGEFETDKWRTSAEELIDTLVTMIARDATAPAAN
ncbi:hypothetical protein Ato02nite_016450 [Paractinoplanes toevensis]|uniref:Uncharacterized protein n=1 Tax=Paractinoplanes toevensis TaxID=571911 RepID=A0A919VZ81_9ACTN|nr:hypothetical protein Ato02nite_016450 [Actinoplanes toevensis]